MTVRVLSGTDLGRLGTREPFRHHSHVPPVADGVIAGPGVDGHVPARQWLSRRGHR